MTMFASIENVIINNYRIRTSSLLITSLNSRFIRDTAMFAILFAYNKYILIYYFLFSVR